MTHSTTIRCIGIHNRAASLMLFASLVAILGCSRSARPTGLTYRNLNSVVSVAVFMPDGNSILTGCMDGTLRIWHTNTGAEIRRLAPRECARVHSGGTDRTLKLWNLVVLR